MSERMTDAAIREAMARLDFPMIGAWSSSFASHYDRQRQDVRALAAEALARGEEIASAERHAQRLAALLSNSDAYIKRMADKVADATRRADEAEDEIELARAFIDARGIARGLGGHYGLREIIAQQLHRAESAEAEVAAVRADKDQVMHAAEANTEELCRAWTERDDARAEVARLRADNDRLRTVEWGPTRFACVSCGNLMRPVPATGMQVPERTCAPCRRVSELEGRLASARDAALAEAQAIAERCWRERASIHESDGAVDELWGKKTEARRIADEIAALRGQA